MTHEYVIAVGGSILGTADDGETERATAATPAPTAIAWAADRILAVGSDAAVRSISRGDSTFIDLAGCAVTPAPADLAAAEAAVRAAVDTGLGAGAHPASRDLFVVLTQAGLLDPGAPLEPGAPAELAFWSSASGADASEVPTPTRIIAVVRLGAFVDGDEHLGPFRSAARR